MLLRRLSLLAASVTGLYGTAASATEADDDFMRRASHPDVVRYFDFDDAQALEPFLLPAGRESLCQQSKCAQIDDSIYTSGEGSLRFETPSGSGSDTSGSFSMNFTPGSRNWGVDSAYPVQFGPGEEFYVQWRQRFNRAQLETRFTGTYAGAYSNGFKQIIVGQGDTPGSGYEASSCTVLEVVLQNSEQRGFPQGYHGCGYWDSFATSLPPYDYKLQNGIPEPFCLYSENDEYQVIGKEPCFLYRPDEWFTYQLRVKIGQWEEYNSLVELWGAREGQPSQLLISTTLRLHGYSGIRYGKVWLLPYQSGKTPSTHPSGYTWYDELIISRSKIADPGAAPSQDSPQPNPPANLTAE